MELDQDREVAVDHRAVSHLPGLLGFNKCARIEIVRCLGQPKAASEAVSGEVIKPDDELEKLRTNLLHAYDKPKPLTRRIIEAVQARAPRKTREHETKKKEDAA